MIVRISKDFTENELTNFQNEYPHRYSTLCKIIGEFELSNINISLAIVLPYKEDYGVIISFKKEGDMVEILSSTKY